MLVSNEIIGRIISAPTKRLKYVISCRGGYQPPVFIILIPNLLIDFVYKESRLKGGKSKPVVLTEIV